MLNQPPDQSFHVLDLSHIQIEEDEVVAPPRHPVFGAAMAVVFICLVTLFSLTWSLRKQESKEAATAIASSDVLAASLPNPSLPSEATPSAVLGDVIGFLPSWMIAKNTPVDLSPLTQIIYFGLGVNAKGELIVQGEDGNPVLEWTYFTSPAFAQIRQDARGRGVKVLVSIKSFDNTTMDTLMSSPAAVSSLVGKVLQLMEEYQLDGVNVDFEYVTATDFPTVRYFNQFLKTLSARVHTAYPGSIVSIDLGALAAGSDPAYDLSTISQTVDQIILMAYDYHRAESLRAGPVAPIQAFASGHSIRASLTPLLHQVPSSKVILGVPFYGYEWQTTSERLASATVPGSGALASYKRVTELLEKRTDIKKVWDDTAQSPWLVYRDGGAIKQIYYEDPSSVAAKIALVHSQQLGGIAIWTLGYEGEAADIWEPIREARGTRP